MGLFSKLFKKKNTAADLSVMFAEASPECKKLLALKNQMDSLLSDDRYVARSEYSQMLLEAKTVVEYFGVLKTSKMLKSFCESNGIDPSVVESTLAAYGNFSNLVDNHNEEYIKNAMVTEKK